MVPRSWQRGGPITVANDSAINVPSDRRLGQQVSGAGTDLARRGEAPASTSGLAVDRVSVDRQVIETRSALKQTLPKGRRRRVTRYPPTTPAGVDLAGLVAARFAEVGPEALLFPVPRGGWARRSNYGRNTWDRGLCRQLAPAPRRALGVDLPQPAPRLRHLGHGQVQPGLRIEDVSRLWATRHPRHPGHLRPHPRRRLRPVLRGDGVGRGSANNHDAPAEPGPGGRVRRSQLWSGSGFPVVAYPTPVSAVAASRQEGREPRYRAILSSAPATHRIRRAEASYGQPAATSCTPIGSSITETLAAGDSGRGRVPSRRCAHRQRLRRGLGQAASRIQCARRSASAGLSRWPTCFDVP